jgi:predicted transcriptional regulator
MRLDENDQVHQLVQRPTVYVHRNDTLRRVAETFIEESIGAALVRGNHGAIGLVSERDIVRAVAEGSSVDRTHAEDVMTEDLVTVGPNDDVLDAVHRMLDAEIRHLPVVEDGVAGGMISARDALQMLVTERETPAAP